MIRDKKMKKISVIFGTRPEAIKLIPIILKMKTSRHLYRIKVCVTAQHRHMLDQVLDLFGVEPDYDLNIMRENQSLFDITVNELMKLEELFRADKPDLILVQGDTTTTFAASLAAYYTKIKVGHVEAGLRTYDKFCPFPEEINRRLTDCLTDLYFAPTEKAKKNLLHEGFQEKNIHVTGNTVIDALLMTIEKQNNKKTQEFLENKIYKESGIAVDNRNHILVTAHRRESFGIGLKNICLALKKIAHAAPNCQIIWPVHLNPNVRNPAEKILSSVANVHMIHPLDYFSFVWLMNRSTLILTDSGGIQEEAPSLGKPVLVMRNKTERPEGIEAGTAKLVGTNSKNILDMTLALLEDKKLYESMAHVVNPYGDGKASDRILAIIESEMSRIDVPRRGNSKSKNN